MRTRNEDGFTLIEVLVVIVVLGILATVALVAVDQVVVAARDRACDEDRRTLESAAGFYLDTNRLSSFPPGQDTSADRFEWHLVDAELILDVSRRFDVNSDGSVSPAAGGHCT